MKLCCELDLELWPLADFSRSRRRSKLRTCWACWACWTCWICCQAITVRKLLDIYRDCFNCFRVFRVVSSPIHPPLLALNCEIKFEAKSCTKARPNHPLPRHPMTAFLTNFSSVVGFGMTGCWFRFRLKDRIGTNLPPSSPLMTSRVTPFMTTLNCLNSLNNVRHCDVL